MKSVFLCENADAVKNVYSEDTVSLLKKTAGIDKKVYLKNDILSSPDSFRNTEYIFSTWGMSQLSAEEIKKFLPSLKCVFYAAGTVQYFARPFLDCGVKVFSAWAANAVPVAEYTAAQIILANKGFFRAQQKMSAGKVKEAKEIFSHYKGNYGAKVGIIGAGMIGKLVIKALKAHRLSVLVFDPFLPDSTAEELGVKKCGLEELFSSCSVVSNHLANNEQTKGMLTGSLFSSMPPYSVFLNTGRGAQVVESELADVLEAHPDLTAILDVTEPEPPLPDSRFYTLENCILTPHIAGSSGNEVHRMAEYMAEEFSLYISGAKTKYEVTLKTLETMA